MAPSETYTLADSRLKSALDALDSELQRLNAGYQAVQAAYDKHKRRDLMAGGEATSELLNLFYGPVLACREPAPLQSIYHRFEGIHSEIEAVQSMLAGLRERQAHRQQTEAARQAQAAQIEAAERAEYARMKALTARYEGSGAG